MRTPETIKEEIAKVKKAKKGAERKITRCDERLAQLEDELDDAETEGA